MKALPNRVPGLFPCFFVVILAVLLGAGPSAASSGGFCADVTATLTAGNYPVSATGTTAGPATQVAVGNESRPGCAGGAAATCLPCSAGQQCQIGQCVVPRTAASCPNGCCDGSGACQPGDTDQACGACGVTDSCDRDATCDSSSCNGCTESGGPDSGDYWATGLEGSASTGYWSATADAPTPPAQPNGCAWYIDFSNGRIDYWVETNDYAVRCVK
jgi:hypothetical protein